MELIERESFLHLLQTQFSKVAGGEGHCVFVSGEAGIGKTSLVKTFCRLQGDDCIVYQGACDALFTPRPLAPLYDIIWQVNKELWPATQTIEQRTALFATFFRELKSQNKRNIILFEDIHWADEATLDFIKFFARRITQLPCLFVLTYRDDETPFYSSLRNLYGQLPPDSFTRLQLTPFSKEAVTAMAGKKGYNAEDVYLISGGNPFYVNEILASYSPGVPENIKDSILAVYDRLEEGTKHAWQICSVIPEGLEINRFAKIKSSWDEEMDHCFALKIIIIKNDRVVFKHELYRRTIEGSLSPFKRIALNKMMLDLFLTSFEDEGDIERIVHYAKNANENGLVIKYASVAAKQAASVGAHTEAAKLYLTAIDYYQGVDEDLLLQLYEGYAFESYLTNKVKDAIIYTAKSLKFLEKRGDSEKLAKCLCFLAWLCWIDDDLKKAEEFTRQAIEVLKDKPVSHSKAAAYSLLSQLKMMSDLSEECIFWGEKAIAMAKDLLDKGLLSYALGNVGAVKIRVPAWQQEGLSLLQQSLEIGLENSYHEYTGMAYINLAYNSVIIKDYPSAKSALDTGIHFCEENNLYLSGNYLLIVKARFYLETGNWTAAYNIAAPLAGDDKQLKIITIYALSILASIEMRRGDPAAIISRLTKATSYAFETTEPQRIITVLSAFLEYEWIMGEHLIDDELLKNAIQIIQNRGNIYGNSEFLFWMQRARGQSLLLKEVFQGYDISSPAKAKKAASLWKNAGCPYNEALALSAGTEDDKREAIGILQGLGADAVVQTIKAEMRSAGMKSIPRGMRKSTLSNAALLTGRELDVLQLLKEGLQNKEIAGKLFIAPKTVDHHISSILFKLDVTSRAKAVNEAVRQEIIK